MRAAIWPRYSSDALLHAPCDFLGRGHLRIRSGKAMFSKTLGCRRTVVLEDEANVAQMRRPGGHRPAVDPRISLHRRRSARRMMRSIVVLPTQRPGSPRNSPVHTSKDVGTIESADLAVTLRRLRTLSLVGRQAAGDSTFSTALTLVTIQGDVGAAARSSTDQPFIEPVYRFLLVIRPPCRVLLDHALHVLG